MFIVVLKAMYATVEVHAQIFLTTLSEQTLVGRHFVGTTESISCSNIRGKGVQIQQSTIKRSLIKERNINL